MNNRKKRTSHRTLTCWDIICMIIEFLAFICQILLSVIYFNWLEQQILIYAGVTVIIVSLFIGWRARVEIERKGDAQEGESWLNTTTVVDSGIYSIVRHPMYLSFMLLSIALVLISQHWLNLMLCIILVACLYDDMRREEKSCIEKLGDNYKKYMKNVPRVNFISGIIKNSGRRNNG